MRNELTIKKHTRETATKRKSGKWYDALLLAMQRQMRPDTVREKGKTWGNPLFRDPEMPKPQMKKGVCRECNVRVCLGVVETDFVGFLSLSDLLHVLGQLLDVVGR